MKNLDMKSRYLEGNAKDRRIWSIAAILRSTHCYYVEDWGISMTMQKFVELLVGLGLWLQVVYLSFIAIADVREHGKNLEVSKIELKCTGIGFCEIVIDTKGKCSPSSIFASMTA